MKWFGTKAATGDARPVLARAWGSGAVALGEWPASYEAQVRSGVMSNAVAQRALRLVSEGAGATVLKAYGVDAAAQVLALVQRTSAGQGLVETLASHLLLHGNAYVQVMAGVDGMPAELFALRPERVSVERRRTVNLFLGLSKCGVCGGAAVYLKRTRTYKLTTQSGTFTRERKTHAYLKCNSARYKHEVCTNPSHIPYEVIERIVLDNDHRS